MLNIMQHYHALDIRVLTVTESAVVEAPSMVIVSARAEKPAEGGLLC